MTPVSNSSLTALSQVCDFSAHKVAQCWPGRTMVTSSHRTVWLTRTPPPVAARLPFKRLNLTPKKGEEATDTPSTPASTVRRQGHHLEISLDNVENECGMAPGVDLGPKLLNGEGPLGQRRGNWDQNVVAPGTVVIDLTEDSCEAPEDPSSRSPPCPEAATVTGATSPRPAENGIGVTEEQGLPEAIPKVKAELVLPKETFTDAPCDPEEVGIISQDGEALSCPELPPAPGSPTECPPQARDSWREAEGILFRGKVPMVVLQDILATKAAPSRECESDLPESGPEEDSGLSHSSPSSSSPGSSPEGQPAPKKRRSRTSLSPSSTPADRVRIPVRSQDTGLAVSGPTVQGWVDGQGPCLLPALAAYSLLTEPSGLCFSVSAGPVGVLAMPDNRRMAWGESHSHLGFPSVQPPPGPGSGPGTWGPVTTAFGPALAVVGSEPAQGRCLNHCLSKR